MAGQQADTRTNAPTKRQKRGQKGSSDNVLDEAGPEDVQADAAPPRQVVQTKKRTTKPKFTKLRNPIAQQLCKLISEQALVSEAETRKVLDALVLQAADQLRKTGRFKLHGLANFKRKATQERPEQYKNICGKQVLLKARPAGQKVHVTVSKLLKDASSDEAHEH